MVPLEKYVSNIKKYSASVDEAAVASIVKHLGIALRNRDSSFVAATDPEELKRVRESWLKKKLGLTASDTELDQAIKSVVERMKAERMKERVVVYYLLAEHFSKLGSLTKTTAAPKKKIA